MPGKPAIPAIDDDPLALGRTRERHQDAKRALLLEWGAWGDDATKRVAAAVGEGSVAVGQVHDFLATRADAAERLSG